MTEKREWKYACALCAVAGRYNQMRAFTKQVIGVTMTYEKTKYAHPECLSKLGVTMAETWQPELEYHNER